MKINEVLRRIMADTKTTQKRLMEMLNSAFGENTVKSQSIIAERLKRDTLNFGTVVEMLSVMGYEIVIQPKSTRGKRAVGSYVADNKDE